MISVFFIKLKAFPLNLHGKIDKRALPKPENLLYLEIPYAAPENQTQEKLADIWAQVLKLKKIGINNRFIDLGGDSLRGVRIVSEIFQAFKIQVRFEEIFPNSTIATLADMIDNTEIIQTEPSPV